MTARRSALIGIIASAALALAGACASLYTDAAAYFGDAEVGALDLRDPYTLSGFTVLDGVVDRYAVFLAGEVHGVAENLDYTYALFRYLHDRRGVRTYLAEMGFAAGEQLNAYVQGAASEEDLARVMDASRGTYAWTREWRAFWRKLRRWNEQVEPGSRIRVVGIDVEHQAGLGFAYIADLLPATPAGSDIATVASELAGWSAAIGAPASRDLAERAHDSMGRYQSQWSSYLGDAYHLVRIAVGNIVRRFEYYENPRDAEVREAAIYRNFIDVFEHVLGPDERRFVGLWGNVHVPTAPVSGFAWLGSRLQHGVDSPVSGAVFAIAPYYDGSTALRTFPYRSVPLSSGRHIVRLLAPYATTTATLFYLDGDDSPLQSSPALSPDGRTPTTRMYQAAVLFSRARASTPLDQ